MNPNWFLNICSMSISAAASDLYEQLGWAGARLGLLLG
jgi:hypothetical protein